MSNRFATKKKRGSIPFMDLILPIVIFVVFIALFFQGIGGLSQTTESEQLRSAKNAVSKAVVQCYALEGQYPSSIDYLVEHYGLSVDQEKYIIHYSVFASNIMPEIDVLPREF